MRKRIVMIFAIMMTVAMIGVGFAAWIITAPTENVHNDGTVSVETVENQGWKFNAYWVDSASYENDGTEAGKSTKNPVIVFGTPKTPDATIKNPYLVNTTIGEENMVAHLYVQGVKLFEGNYVIEDSADISLDFYKTVSGETSKVEKSEYNAYFTTKLTVDGTVVSQLTPQQLIEGVVVKVEFVWSLADGANPYNYFNKLGYESASEAANFLTGLHTAVNGLTFQIDLVAVK